MNGNRKKKTIKASYEELRINYGQLFYGQTFYWFFFNLFSSKQVKIPVAGQGL